MNILDSIRAFFSPAYRALLERRKKSRAELAFLLDHGAVQKVLLLPAEFGGPDIPGNVTYLPPALIAEKTLFEASIRARLAAGEEITYQAIPEYDNDSFVPAKLHLLAEGGSTPISKNLDVTTYRTWA